MKTYLGTLGLQETWQHPFEEIIDCVHCNAPSRVAFVAAEGNILEGSYICDLHENKIASGGSFWVHDVTATAVYFCTKCCKATAVFNQA